MSFKDEHLHLNTKTVATHIQTVAVDYLQIKRQADWHNTWLGQLIAVEAEDQHTTKKSQWKKIRQMEAIWKRCSLLKVKRALGQLQLRLRFLQVMAPVEGKGMERMTYTNKEDLEKACLDKAHRQFIQAATTPMLTEPMLSTMGLTDIDSPMFQHILDGTFICPTSCNPITCWLLQWLVCPEVVLDNQTFEEYQCGWQQAQATTCHLHLQSTLATILQQPPTWQWPNSMLY